MDRRPRPHARRILLSAQKDIKNIAASNPITPGGEDASAVIESQSEDAAARPANTPPSTAGMTTKVVKGSLWTLAGQVAPLAVSLVATPFTIRLLGAEGYGVLILVSLIPMYLGFADLGMGIASTKFGSEAYAAGDAEKEARTVRTAAALSLLLSVPFAIAIFALAGWIVTLFNVPEHLLGEATLALRVAAFTFVLNFLNQIFNTPQLDRLRMDLNTFVTSGFRILGIAATPIVIYLGGGILGAVVVLFVASLLTLFGHIYVSGRLLPNLWDLSLDRTVIRPLLKFGTALAIATLAALTVLNLEKLVLPAFVTVEALAYYSVAFTVASMLIVFGKSMVQSLIPAFSQLQGTEKNDARQNLFDRGLRFNIILVIPALTVLAVVAEPFFTIWAGKDFGRESSLPFYVLLPGMALCIPAFLPHSTIMAAGRADIFAKLYIAEMIPYIGLAALLTWKLHILGAALSWSIMMVVDASCQFLIARKVAGVKLLAATFKGLPAAAAIMIVPSVICMYIEQFSTITLAVVALCGIVYAWVIWSWVLMADEQLFIRGRLEMLVCKFQRSPTR
ncbi:MAG: flippase [Acidobacteria bacterium]|nr:flippase [Acidobacteriota bacterium]